MGKINEIIDNIKSAEPIDFGEIKDNSAAKIKALINRKQVEEIIEEKEEERRIKVWVIILAIIGVVAIGCLVGFLIYRKNKPDYLDDFDDDFEDDDDFFDED